MLLLRNPANLRLCLNCFDDMKSVINHVWRLFVCFSLMSLLSTLSHGFDIRANIRDQFLNRLLRGSCCFYVFIDDLVVLCDSFFNELLALFDVCFDQAIEYFLHNFRIVIRQLNECLL